MEEIKCKQVATQRGGKWEKTYEESRRVYGVDGLAPTVHTQGGGNQETKILVEPLAYDEQNGYLREDGIVGTITTDGSSPKHNNRVVEPIVYDVFNGQVRTDSSTIGTITRNVGADLKRNGQGIIEPVIIEDFYKNRGNRYYDQEAPTIRADRDGLKVAEPLIIREKPLKREGWHEYAKEVLSVDGLCRTISTQLNNLATKIKEPVQFRVRKLTERECFRLQGVKDTDFAKIRQNQSKSSCYHLAGDSITTSVLMALFGQMLGIDWRSKVDELVEEIKK